MKPYLFDAVEYQDLNSLGIAFADQFDLALQAIQEKSFIKFVNKFKQYRTKIRSILYESHYLQNALSMIIYLITEEHILYIGHQRYHSIEECLRDIKSNPTFKYFAEDHGFSNTILPTLEDEKLKTDLLTFEEFFTEDLAFDYLKSYSQKDSIEPIDQLSTISSSADPFRTAKDVFGSYSFQLSIAQRYFLKDAIQLKKSTCPVFFGIRLTKAEFEAPLSFVQSAFYHSLLQHFKKCKYKGSLAKKLLRKLKECKKKYKSYEKHSFSAKLSLEEQLYSLYLEWVTLYKLEKIKVLDPALEPTIPYCETYISQTIAEELSLTADSTVKEFVPIVKCEYDLMKFYNSIKNHRNFSIWSIVFVCLGLILYTILLFLDATRDGIINGISQIQDNTSLEDPFKLPFVSHLLFFIGAGLSIGMAIFILILHLLSKKKYNKLCRLSFYRKNEAILSEAEQTEFETLKEKEALYAKTIDRFYRFCGGITLAGISLGIVLIILGCIAVYGSLFFKDLSGVTSYFTNKLYFVLIPPVLCMGLGFLRHKKTSWSVFIALFISILLTAGLVAIIFL